MAENNKSIVNIIETMLSNGESADKIMLTLKDLGVQEEQAKTLLMMAQTNSFAVLKGDISQQVNDKLNESYPKLEKQLTEIVNQKTIEAQNNISKNVLNEISTKEQNYEQEQKKTVDKVINISVEQDQKIEVIKNKMNEIGTNYDKLALGSTKSLLYLRIASFVIGLALLIILIIKFFTLMPGYSIDYLIFYAIIGILSAILMVLSLI